MQWLCLQKHISSINNVEAHSRSVFKRFIDYPKSLFVVVVLSFQKKYIIIIIKKYFVEKINVIFTSATTVSLTMTGFLLFNSVNRSGSFVFSKISIPL